MLDVKVAGEKSALLLRWEKWREKDFVLNLNFLTHQNFLYCKTLLLKACKTKPNNMISFTPARTAHEPKEAASATRPVAKAIEGLG